MVRIQAAAQAVGLSPSTLRKLEASGEIPRVQRNRSGQRLYSAEDLAAIRDHVQAAVAAGHQELTAAQRAVEAERGAVALQEAEEIKAAANMAARQYETCWARLKEKLEVVQRTTGASPAWLRDAVVEFDQPELILSTRDGVVSLPTLGAPRYR
jgi:DNA-binding transcriptional MerR regulator